MHRMDVPIATHYCMFCGLCFGHTVEACRMVELIQTLFAE